MEEKIKKLQDWVKKKDDIDLSYDEAAKIFSQVRWYGYSIFVAAYDILMGDDPGEDL